jgi:hypothetical protein
LLTYIPGTGKSLVGAVIAHVLLRHTEEKILVLSYKNHAIDQFLEDLMDIGIDPSLMVRLGSKSTARTAPLLLSNMTPTYVPRTRSRYELINQTKLQMEVFSEEIENSFDYCMRNIMSNQHILQHLEFSDGDEHFFDAFCIPGAEDGQIRVGPNGRRFSPDWLLFQWSRGRGAGVFSKEKAESVCRDIWRMNHQERAAKMQEWRKNLRDERIRTLVEQIDRFNKHQKVFQSLLKEKNKQILGSKRVIGCTTTAASMYAEEIQAAAPGIIIVEEAGEILECHILAAMGPSVKQLIQIGDHKQLRPRVKNYKLTVESGRGYDLNRSLLERLIMQGRPHCTLLSQHRMRPEISELIRHNYPNLRDAKGTEGRPKLRGFQDNVIFFNHNHLEEKHNVLADKLDQGSTSSKQNVFEADMVLKCVRYLGQQGYRTADLVILTPYLVCPSHLRSMMKRRIDRIRANFLY